MGKLDTLKILLIEDGEADRMIFSNYIDDIDSEIYLESESTLIGGISFLQENEIDIVILDLNLPDCKGLDSLIQLKKQFPQIAVIVLSGNRDILIADEAIAIGASDYLLKAHLDPDRLQRTLLYNLERIKKDELLKKRYKELEQFTYIATHDLKSPLNNMIQLLEYLNGDEEERATYMEMMKQSMDSLKNIIASLTDVLELKSTIKSSPKEEVALEDIISDVLRDHNYLISEQNIEVILELEKGVKKRYNKAHLKSIVQNLVSNAIKYKGKVNPKIILKTYSSNADVVFQCEDNGLGIDLQKEGGNIFKMFKRFHKKSEIEGKGIGLSMINSIVEENGGKILLESEPNVGSNFKVFL